MSSPGFLSLLPALVAVVLAFVTRDALFSILIGVIAGLLVAGQDPVFGLTSLAQHALGNADFIWVVCIEVSIGIMIAFFKKSGAISAFVDLLEDRINITHRMARGLSVLLGILVYFTDYFSPLFVGNIMRPVTDRLRISREKLAYYCDCTSAPKCVVFPFSAWGVYVAGLLVGFGTFADTTVGLSGVVRSVPFQFYGLVTILMAVLNALGILPDFGPMKTAERRARETGMVIADGDTPMLSEELEQIRPREGWKANVWLHFVVPSLVVIGITFGSYFATGSAKALEAFVAAVICQAIILLIQRAFTISEMTHVATQGIKSVTGAILILSLAYCINDISKTLGTSNYVIEVTKSWLGPQTLLVFTFLVCAFMSFFTGTSWGVYAIIIPIVIPLAFSMAREGDMTLVYATIASVMGGGCFGDHCSPLSDTTILSSLGSGSDHMAHVKTQLPYAILGAVLTSVGYLILGCVL